MHARRQFFVGETYQPCGNYKDSTTEYERLKNLNELKKITIPVPRPEGAVEDCLHCKRLNGINGCYPSCTHSRQGLGRICSDYEEVNIRPNKEPKHCLYCLENYMCTRGRVLRDGQPCKKYFEYAIEPK